MRSLFILILIVCLALGVSGNREACLKELTDARRHKYPAAEPATMDNLTADEQQDLKRCLDPYQDVSITAPDGKRYFYVNVRRHQVVA